MKNLNIGTTVLRLIPAVFLLLAVASVNPHHINWRPRTHRINPAQQCLANANPLAQQVKLRCVSALRS